MFYRISLFVCITDLSAVVNAIGLADPGTRCLVALYSRCSCLGSEKLMMTVMLL